MPQSKWLAAALLLPCGPISYSSAVKGQSLNEVKSCQQRFCCLVPQAGSAGLPSKQYWCYLVIVHSVEACATDEAIS